MQFRCALFSCCLLALNAFPPDLSAATIRFDQATYEVAVGEAFLATVELDAPIAEGLFSFGVQVGYDPALGLITSPAMIAVPAALDFNGVNGPPAVRDAGPGFAGAKGTINALLPATSPYTGTTLAVFQLMFDQPGTYPLDLDLFRTLGPTEDIFISGNGTKLDSILLFQGAEVTVVPEPNTLWLSLLAIPTLLLCRRRPASWSSASPSAG